MSSPAVVVMTGQYKWTPQSKFAYQVLSFPNFFLARLKLLWVKALGRITFNKRKDQCFHNYWVCVCVCYMCIMHVPMDVGESVFVQLHKWMHICGTPKLTLVSSSTTHHLIHKDRVPPQTQSSWILASLSTQLTLGSLALSLECWDYRQASSLPSFYIASGDPTSRVPVWMASVLSRAVPESHKLIFTPVYTVENARQRGNKKDGLYVTMLITTTKNTEKLS